MGFKTHGGRVLQKVLIINFSRSFDLLKNFQWNIFHYFQYLWRSFQKCQILLSSKSIPMKWVKFDFKLSMHDQCTLAPPRDKTSYGGSPPQDSWYIYQSQGISHGYWEPVSHALGTYNTCSQYQYGMCNVALEQAYEILWRTMFILCHY